jgi:hypothetical protein
MADDVIGRPFSLASSGGVYRCLHICRYDRATMASTSGRCKTCQQGEGGSVRHFGNPARFDGTLKNIRDDWLANGFRLSHRFHDGRTLSS